MGHHKTRCDEHFRFHRQRFGSGLSGQEYQRGAMLVEVMVAGLLLVISVAALGSAQQAALAAVHSAEIRTGLAGLHASILDRMRLDPQRVRSGGFDVSIPDLHHPDEIATQYPHLEDISATLHRHHAEGFLRIGCDNAGALICNVCIGVFLPPDIGPSGQRASMPGNRLCGRYLVG